MSSTTVAEVRLGPGLANKREKLDNSFHPARIRRRQAARGLPETQCLAGGVLPRRAYLPGGRRRPLHGSKPPDCRQ